MVLIKLFQIFTRLDIQLCKNYKFEMCTFNIRNKKNNVGFPPNHRTTHPRVWENVLFFPKPKLQMQK